MEKNYQNNPNGGANNQRGFGKNLFLETFKNESGKLPPQALELEEAVLGALMIEKDALTAVVDILQPSSFYKEAHQRIYNAILQLFGKSEPIDMLTVTTQLRSNGELEFIGGASYLVKLTNKVNSAANIEYHARIITQSAIKRDMIKIAGEILKDAYEDTTDVFNLLDKIEQNFFEISERNIRKNYADASTIMRATIDELEKKKNNKDGLTGVASGFTALDRITSGWQNTELTIIAARPAMGKCLGKGTKVLMYDGSLKSVEDIERGELLMGDDSTPRKVLSIARGQEKMYWIRQNKGIDYRVNESHILSLKRSRNEGGHKKGEVLNVTVKDYLGKSDKFKSNYKGYKVAVEFDEKYLEIEPYFLGLWLGDGHSYSSRITNIDTEVVGYLGNYAERLDLELVTYEQAGKTNNYGITKGYRGGQDFFSIQNELRELNLLQNKHIPQHFLINSTENRLQLLAGLLDSDGNYDSIYNCFEISQKNETLAKQIKFLCDSLGFRTSIKEKKTTIKALNFEGTAFRVRLFGNLDTIPTKIERKQACPLKAKTDWRVTGIKVELDKVDDYYGFEIDGNRLFLLEDMTVTHNTAFVVSAMRNAAVEWGIPVAMFSLEMSATQLMLRLISAEAEIDSNKLRKGKLENHEWVQLHQKIKNLSSAPIYIDDTPALSILEMRAKCRRLKAQFDIGLVIIDYLQLMTAESGGGGKGNREQEIAAISRAMKNLAKEINVPVIALSQLSRAVETRGGDKRPQLSDLRESGSIEQDADMVMFLYRPEYYKITQDEQGNSTEGVGEVIIAKNRSGDVDTVKLKFIGKYTKFTDLDGFYTPLPGQDNFGDFNMPAPINTASSLDNFEKSAPQSNAGTGGTVTLGSKANQPRNLDDEKDFPFLKHKQILKEMIGVFDSGIGGLTLLHEIIRQLPNEQYCYYADTENVPYSTKSEEQIKEYVEKAVDYFLQKKVKAIVLACNTATNVCIEDLRSRFSLPIIAIQPAVKVAVDNDVAEFDFHRKKILVCATPITLRSARFQRLVDSLNADGIVERMALPELVKLAEKEEFGKPAENYITETLLQLDIKQFGSIVLGCTHFTYFEPIFYQLAPQLSIFDGNEGTARHLKNILDKLNLLSPKAESTFSVEYIESGKPTQNLERFQRYIARIEQLI